MTGRAINKKDVIGERRHLGVNLFVQKSSYWLTRLLSKGRYLFMIFFRIYPLSYSLGNTAILNDNWGSIPRLTGLKK
ncbi:MAG: hypothetical protein CFH41_02845 [Alphaproteobacteria bacterium MarineAlpha11_Bin1]|nr:MAG: hypothetical protein CFH41_02845 [Alphaproteobacteria bacterium MarineAlpha11_Bin1]